MIANYCTANPDEIAAAVKAAARKRATKGFCIIVDGRRYPFARYCKKLISELNGICGAPTYYRNMLGELAIDFDTDGLGNELPLYLGD